jgi:hypothetical protein
MPERNETCSACQVGRAVIAAAAAALAVVIFWKG